MIVMSKEEFEAFAADWNKTTTKLKESGCDLSKIKIARSDSGESNDKD